MSCARSDPMPIIPVCPARSRRSRPASDSDGNLIHNELLLGLPAKECGAADSETGVRAFEDCTTCCMSRATLEVSVLLQQRADIDSERLSRWQECGSRAWWARKVLSGSHWWRAFARAPTRAIAQIEATAFRISGETLVAHSSAMPGAGAAVAAVCSDHGHADHADCRLQPPA